MRIQKGKVEEGGLDLGGPPEKTLFSCVKASERELL